MFENLSEKFQGVLKKLRGHGRISEGNIEGALNEVRLALLEADVNYKVVKDFVAAVKEKALGAEVLASLSPDQHFIKIVHEEMTRMMGAQAQELDLARKPPVSMMLVGLQGRGRRPRAGNSPCISRRRNGPVPGPGRRLPSRGDRAAEGPRAAARDPRFRLPPRRRPGSDLPGGGQLRRAQRLRHGPPRHGGAPPHRRAADGGALPDQGGG